MNFLRWNLRHTILVIRAWLVTVELTATNTINSNCPVAVAYSNCNTTLCENAATLTRFMEHIKLLVNNITHSHQNGANAVSGGQSNNKLWSPQQTWSSPHPAVSPLFQPGYRCNPGPNLTRFHGFLCSCRKRRFCLPLHLTISISVNACEKHEWWENLPSSQNISRGRINFCCKSWRYFESRTQPGFFFRSFLESFLKRKKKN